MAGSASSDVTPRYGPKVRIGNWAEDEARFALAARDYEARRARGELLHLKKAAEKAFQVQTVPLSSAADGLVRYGATVQVAADRAKPVAAGHHSHHVHSTARHLLACNINSSLRPGLIRVTGAAATTEPQARAAFVVQPARSSSAASSASSDATVKYGDRIMLLSDPALTLDPVTRVVGVQFALQSQRSNNVMGSGRKGWQEVGMTQVWSPDCEWVLLPTGEVGADGTMPLEGEPVRAGDDFVLIHAMTNQALAADPSLTTASDFGTELEVHASTYRRPAHASMSVTGELPLSSPQAVNRWKFVLAAATEEEVAAAPAGKGAGADGGGAALSGSTRLGATGDLTGRAFMKPLTVETVLEKARHQLRQACGIHGLRSLTLALAALDERGAGVVPADSARLALTEHGVLLPEPEMRMLLSALTRGRYITSSELIAALSGDGYSAARREAVATAYAHLAATAVGRGSAGAKPASGEGAATLTVADVKAAFDAKFDPRVLEKTLTPLEAGSEFARQWPAHTRPTAPVTAADFDAYYRAVSPCVPDDFDFIEMVANVWHVPGHGSWKGKRGKRVLVTFHKGSSTEVVIPAAEDIADTDFVGLSTALKAMGFGGIARVKVLEMVDAE